ncbi:DUF192 domain-containing protein [Sphingomonas panacisoli]|uniref:DUF192 domain-containing protein n=1 Tax=Sphingomonas panacisoli TaxID=1813879 RepID=A0A5B8LJ70_9SPHN|nr:DUF192 domain-containing protein [Sphingomonas panacisoli]QDZ07996.1 DUF192 domain-containing protein [Sphingomonas panacisoli]
MTVRGLLLPLALCALSAGCASGSGSDNSAAAVRTMTVTIASKNGAHPFQVEQAKTADEQERGLMFRMEIPVNGGMMFWPYPPDGPPREASFWMKNTPSALDIIFIRADGTIAHIAANAVPFDETPLSSGEPVGAVLEIKGGRAAALGIAEGDKVNWAK